MTFSILKSSDPIASGVLAEAVKRRGDIHLDVMAAQVRDKAGVVKDGWLVTVRRVGDFERFVSRKFCTDTRRAQKHLLAAEQKWLDAGYTPSERHGVLFNVPTEREQAYARAVSACGRKGLF